MVHFITLLLALAGLSPLARAQYGYDGDSGPYVSGGNPTSTAAPQQSPSANSTSPIPDRTSAGDVQCGEDMCIGAAVKGNEVEYVMQSTGAHQLGWMAMGFGTSMVGSPMVIMWVNPDQTFSLSQRQARERSLPSVDPNPSRRATVSVDLSSWSGNKPKLAFRVPIGTDMQPKVIWAFGTDVPTDAVPEQATFHQHVSNGFMTFDLNKSTSVSALESPAVPLADNNGNDASGRPQAQPLSGRERIILAHGVVCAIAYLIVMPAGALLARYYRTISSSWFKGHWILQFGVASPIVFTGVVLAILTRAKTWGTHAQVGVLLFVLYGTQCLLGGVIHFVKPENATRRPVQNYAHAILGITIITLAFYQVRTGYRVEWPGATSRSTPMSVDILWHIWAVCIPLAYFGGLVFLKKQYAQERLSRHRAAQERAKMTTWNEGKFYHV